MVKEEKLRIDINQSKHVIAEFNFLLYGIIILFITLGLFILYKLFRLRLKVDKYKV